MDLQVAGADDRWVSRTIADLHDRGGADSDVEIEQVAAAAAVEIVNRASNEGNRDGVSRIAADAAEDASAVEVDDVDGNFRRFGRDARAGVNDDCLSLKIKAISVANDIPIATFGSFRTATRVHDAAEAEVRGFAFSKCATASQPAGSGRRRDVTEVSAEGEIDVGGVFRLHFDIFAIRIEGSTRRQGSRIYADCVIADGWNL